jgi:hypothetical protein
VTTNWKRPGTTVAAAAWVAVCAYLYLAWPSLVALLGTLVPPGAEPLIRIPRVVFPALGLLTVLGLVAKDRCLRSPMALVVDAVVGAPAFAVLALLLHPFFFSE